ncbi:penicillin-binding protein A [Lutibacter sp. B2]|nr:penicillin-binding protein A [Lutibacter sp. B2]
MDTTAKRIVKVLILFCILLGSLVLYLSYFEIFVVAKIQDNPYNKRQWMREEYVLRGSILDRNEKVLASSIKQDKQQIRNYPFKNLYSHVIGYSFKEYGKTAIEKNYNNQLLGIGNSPLTKVKDKIMGSDNMGNNVVLTIDHTLQKNADELLRGKKGSIVLMNPKTGEIYAMVSKPDFDPNTMRDDWQDIIENKESPLINRATTGLYTPGSVFKMITATSVMENNSNQNYFCEGKTNIGGYVLKDYHSIAHGNVDLEKALIYSCNVAFSQMGIELGEEKLKSTAQKYMFDKQIPFDIMSKKSIFSEEVKMTKTELGVSAIGQGKVLVTPLNMAMVASTIANDGNMMKPFLVKEIINSKNRIIKMQPPKILSHVTNKENANKLRDIMIQVVEVGTGKKAKIKNVRVAGKTGTAENGSDKEHAWFIGFAPANDPKVAIAVVLENEGKTGGTSAAPIAREILKNALNRVQ